MPAPLNWLDNPVMDYSAIYGTFLVEGTIAVMLLVKRFRHYGIALGIAFHLLLALSSYAMYIAFTVLSIAMHVLFIDPKAAERILDSAPMRVVTSRMREPVYVITAVILLLGLGILAFTGAYGLASLFAFPLVLPFCWVILRYGQNLGTSSQWTRAGTVAATVTFAAFFLNGATPYLGLKTAQSLNMFANLRLEQGSSNHVVFSSPDRPFRYLDDVATIDDAFDNLQMQGYVVNDFGIVYYDLLAFLANNPDARVSYSMNGQSYRAVSAADRKAEIDAALHPQWVRKWFHFQPVQLQQPEPCKL